MKESRFWIEAKDGHRLAAYHWAEEGRARGVIVLSHGMGEHARRYPAALRALIESHLDVYAIDHRGHGATAKGRQELGDFGAGGFAAASEDLLELIHVVRRERPDCPVILLGHSMGSMLGQLFALRYSEAIDGLALSGSAAVDRLAGAAANPGILNAAFQPSRTHFDWLSRDNREVDAYIQDPLCGFALVPNSFASMLSFGEKLASHTELANIRSDLPIYVFSGAHDPLNRDLQALEPLVERYRATGHSVEVDVYPEARHEILNETNRTEVVTALRRWIDRVIEGVRAEKT
jgi:alpha-beta hydrolase superfamily lysophospholipase